MIFMILLPVRGMQDCKATISKLNRYILGAIMRGLIEWWLEKKIEADVYGQVESFRLLL